MLYLSMVKCHSLTTDSFKHDTFLKPILTFEKRRQKNKSQKKKVIFLYLSCLFAFRRFASICQGSYYLNEVKEEEGQRFYIHLY